MKLDFSFGQLNFRGSAEIIDTHCHYNLEPLYPEWQRHWQEAQSYGVIRSVVPGTDLETSRRAVEIAQEQGDGRLQALVGIHPGAVCEVKLSVEESMQQLESLLESEFVVGVGEIGLDYFRLESNDEASREQQKVWLKAQLVLANQFDAPVVLHVRDKNTPEEETPGNAYWDVLSAVEELGFPREIVLHCVSGPTAYVQRMINAGAFVSFSANITYPKAQGIRDFLKITPREMILCETDAPFLPPQEYRGQVCEPWMIQKTAVYLQSLLEKDVEKGSEKEDDDEV